MSTLKQHKFNVKFKIGKRSFTQIFYAMSHDLIIQFCELILQAKVVQISQIVYDAGDSVKIPIDDKSTQKNTLYFMVGNNDHGKASQIVIQSAKLTKSVKEIYDAMSQYLMIDDVSSITSLITVNESSK